MDRENLTTILVQVLTSDEKWQAEVERNYLLQKTIDDLFSDGIFQILLEHGALPKLYDTNIPHYRAIELICSLRELVRQIEEGGSDETTLARDLEDLQFRVTDKWGTAAEFKPTLGEDAAATEAQRIIQLFHSEPQFTARIERFRLLVVPLSAGEGAERASQIVVLENIRPPRSVWARQQR